MDKRPRKPGNAANAGRNSGGGKGRNPRKSGPSGGKSYKSKGMIGGADPDAPKRAYGRKSVGATSQPRKPNRNRSDDDRKDKYRPNYKRGHKPGGASWNWGWHAVKAVLANPSRTIHQIMATEGAAQRLGLSEGRADLKIVAVAYIDKALPRGAAHQGVAVKVAPLEWPDLSTIADASDDDALILILDQITDPHNVGAMIRLCSAFGVSALVMQSRKAPPLTGATAKVAVGCVETVPVCLETNIAQTIKQLQVFGYQVIGLAGETETTVAEALHAPGRYALVMGAEGPGLRDLVAKNCVRLAKIPMNSLGVPGQAESLNVATAAGIALYEARR